MSSFSSGGALGGVGQNLLPKRRGRMFPAAQPLPPPTHLIMQGCQSTYFIKAAKVSACEVPLVGLGRLV
jgi:hypothetical protein